MKYLKYVSVFFLNYLIVLMSITMYQGGAALDFTFIPIQFLTVYLNYKVSSNIIGLGFLNLNLLASTIIANKLVTYLYYNNISSDSETLAVGSLCLIVGIVYILILAIISIVVKSLSNRKNSE